MRKLIFIFLFPIAVYGQMVSMAPLTSSSDYNAPVSSAEAAVSFTIIDSWDWNGETLGDWTDAEMTTWGASATGFWTHNSPPDYMWSIVTDTINGTVSNAMRTKHVGGDNTILPEMRRSLPASYDTIFSSVNVKFGQNWTSAVGKMHGLRTILGANCFDDADGTLVASNFKYGGSFYPYNYEHTLAQPSCPWNFITDAVDTDILFNYGNWYTLTQMVIMNTGSTGSMNSDGQYKWWIDGKLIYEEANLRLAETNDANHKINGYWMASFHGPSEGAAVNDCFLYTDNATFWMPDVWDTDHSTISTPVEITNRDFYYNQSLITVDTDSIYVSSPAAGTNFMWLIDAGVGNTVEVDFSSGTTTASDYLVFYDGNQTDDNIATNGKLIGSSANLGAEFDGSGTITSTGRYMFVKYIVDLGGSGGTFTGNITFN